MFIFKIEFKCKTYQAQQVSKLETMERLEKYDSVFPDEMTERKRYTVHVDLDNPVGIGFMEILYQYYGPATEADYIVYSAEYICQPLTAETTED